MQVQFGFSNPKYTNTRRGRRSGGCRYNVQQREEKLLNQVSQIMGGDITLAETVFVSCALRELR